MRILSRFLNGNFELLEPYEGKLSRTVLRGESGSNAADLLDNLSVTANFLRTQTGVLFLGHIECRLLLVIQKELNTSKKWIKLIIASLAFS